MIETITASSNTKTTSGLLGRDKVVAWIYFVRRMVYVDVFTPATMHLKTLPLFHGNVQCWHSSWRLDRLVSCRRQFDLSLPPHHRSEKDVEFQWCCTDKYLSRRTLSWFLLSDCRLPPKKSAIVRWTASIARMETWGSTGVSATSPRLHLLHTPFSPLGIGRSHSFNQNAARTKTKQKVNLASSEHCVHRSPWFPGFSLCVNEMIKDSVSITS